MAGLIVGGHVLARVAHQGLHILPRKTLLLIQPGSQCEQFVDGWPGQRVADFVVGTRRIPGLPEFLGQVVRRDG